MAFPATVLPMMTEMLLDGVWTDVTSRRRALNGLTITRGRRDWSSRVVASQAAQVFENADGFFSNRLPTSVNFGRLGRNTQIRHRNRWVYDTMDRNVANSWSSTTTGQVWTNAGTAGDYFGDGVRMFHKHTNRNVYRSSTLALPVGCVDVTATVSVPAVATGGPISFHVLAGSGLTDYYAAVATFGTGSTVTLDIAKMSGGGLSTVASGGTVGSYGADTQWSVRIQRLAGGYLRAKAWPASTNQPAAWTVVTNAPDTSLTSFTTAGLRSLLNAANTNALDVFLAFWDFEVNDFRFWGETPAFAPVWDASGKNVTVPVEAAGILQRLSGPRAPERSPLYRSVSGVTPNDYVPAAYWPMEDGPDADRFASNSPDVNAMTFVGTVSPASDETLPGSAALPVFETGSAASFTVPAYADTGAWVVQATVKLSGSATVFALSTDGTGARITMAANFGTGNFDITVYDATGASVYTGALPFVTANITGQWLSVCFGTDGSGTDQFNATYQIMGGSTVFGFGDLISGRYGRITGGTVLAGLTATASVGHVAVFTDPAFSQGIDDVINARAMNGWAGETAGDRLARLCREHSIPFELIGSAASTKTMGPQRIAKLVDLLFDCADVDQGILYEPRDAFGLAYRTGASLYNQSGGPAIDYTAGVLAPPFQPVEDDQLLLNDVTVTRINGSSGRATVTTGPLSTQDPPDGVGTIDSGPQVNLYRDSECEQLAGWLTHLGTWDEARYPVARFEMAAPDVASDAALTAGLAALDLGDVFTVTNLPSWQPPDPAGLMVQGTTEYVGDGKDWALSFNCVPSGPYKVFQMDDTALCRLEGDHALASSVTSTATSWSVKTNSGAVLTADDAQDGQQWMVEGELVTVTDIAGTSSPQTVTVIRSVNGVVKAHGANAPIALYPAPYLAY